MLNVYDLIDNVGLQLSEKTDGQFCFSEFHLMNAYFEIKLCEKTKKQCTFSLIGGHKTERTVFNQFLWTGRYAHWLSKRHGLTLKKI